MGKIQGETSTFDLIKQEIQSFQRQNKNPLEIYCCASKTLVEKLVRILENEEEKEVKLPIAVTVCESSAGQNSGSRSKSRAILIPFVRLEKLALKFEEPELSAPAFSSESPSLPSPVPTETKVKSRSRKKRTKPLNFECAYCDKKFRSNYHKMRHQVVHTGQRDFSCSIWSKNFTDKSYLSTHLKLHSASASARGQKVVKWDRPYKCTHRGCSYAAFQQRILMRHKSVHKEERPFKCPEVNCAYAAKRPDILKRHQLIHQPKSTPTPTTESFRPSAFSVRREPLIFECDYECGKKFPSNYKKLRHHVVHTGERNFSCTICSKTFTSKSDLNKHAKLHSASATVEKVSQEKKKPLVKSERAYKCTHRGCSYAALERKTLIRHKSVHKEERPFKCPEVNCNYAAKRRDTLMGHQLTHQPKPTPTPKPTDENCETLLKFLCSVSGCPFKTKRNYDLMRHLKTHNS